MSRKGKHHSFHPLGTSPHSKAVNQPSLFEDHSSFAYVEPDLEPSAPNNNSRHQRPNQQRQQSSSMDTVHPADSDAQFAARAVTSPSRLTYEQEESDEQPQSERSRLSPTHDETDSATTSATSSPTPSTLNEALVALRAARDEISRLQSKLADATSDREAFASPGMDHSKKQRRMHDSSTSNTRNEYEKEYADDLDRAVGGDLELQEMPSDRKIRSDNEVDDRHHPRVSLDQYFATPFYWLLIKRLPWLVCLLILQSFSASILARYNDFLNAHLIFAFFVPMTVGTGGNAGNQCSVMVTRALALGMSDAEILRVVKKELPVAIITSVTLGLFSFIRVVIEYPHDPASAAAISLTLAISILISIALGILFSYCIDKLKKCDPADGAAPLLSTISDIIGIGLLCGIATAMVK